MGGPVVNCFVFSLLFVVVLSCELQFKDCGSVEGKLTSVGFNGTCSGGKAMLKKGTVVQLQIGLVSNEKSTKLTSVVHGIIAGIPVPFPLGDPDGCKNCNVKCPLQAGQQYLYKPLIVVKEQYPSIKLVVKWELRDDNNKDLVCLEIPAIIQ